VEGTKDLLYFDPLKLCAQVSHAPDHARGGGGVAAEFAGSIFSPRAESFAGLDEGFIHKFTTADDGSVGKIADATTEWPDPKSWTVLN
jgi:hypothetical protein